MGTVKPETLETRNLFLHLPEDRLQEDAHETSLAAGDSQLVATENKILALETRVTQLEVYLAVAQGRIQDLTYFSQRGGVLAHNSRPAPPCQLIRGPAIEHRG